MGKHLNRRPEILDDFTEEKYWSLRKIWRTDQRIVDHVLFCHIQTLAKWKQKNKVYSQPYNVGNSRRKKVITIDVELSKEDIEFIISSLYHIDRGEKGVQDLITHLENQLGRF